MIGVLIFAVFYHVNPDDKDKLVMRCVAGVPELVAGPAGH